MQNQARSVPHRRETPTDLDNARRTGRAKMRSACYEVCDIGQEAPEAIGWLDAGVGGTDGGAACSVSPPTAPASGSPLVRDDGTG
jgi:hypothetical protein